ncbi:MAG: hypothetical protein ABW046_22620 [Actinoplanes sp.]
MKTNADAELAMRVKALEADLVSAGRRIDALDEALRRLQLEMTYLRTGQRLADGDPSC